MILDLVISVCGIVRTLWILCGFALLVKVRIRVIRTIFHELRPFYLPAALFGNLAPVVAQHQRVTVLTAVFFACSIYCWFAYKDVDKDDDDRWKRRRRKVAERVEAAGGRLTVVAGDSA